MELTESVGELTGGQQLLAHLKIVLNLLIAHRIHNAFVVVVVIHRRYEEKLF